MSAMTVKCPSCQTAYSLRDGTRPAKLRCKKCQTVFEVSPPAAPPLEVDSEMNSATNLSHQAPPPKTAAARPTRVAPPNSPSAAHSDTFTAEPVPRRPPSDTFAASPTRRPEPPAPPPREETVVVDAGVDAGSVSLPGPAQPSVSASAPVNSASAPMNSVSGGIPTRRLPEPGGWHVEDPLLGQTLGGYTIIKKLGQGGMGSVYEARQLSLDRSVAVKILSEKLASDPEYLVRFTREALAAGRLGHHNVVQVFDVGESDGLYFFSMEYVRGESLHQIRKREGTIPVDKACGWILQAARGLQYAHERGIVHRDIKPANLMLNDQGLVKVADLGLAKQAGFDEEGFVRNAISGQVSRSESFLTADVTNADAAVGTLGFMSPEQMTDARNVDGRADIYSLGCTLHQLITGKLPFPGRTLRDVMKLQQERQAPDLRLKGVNVPEEIASLLKRMLASDPADRPQSMTRVISELEAWLEKSGKTPRPTPQHAAALENSAKELAAAVNHPLRKALPAGLAAISAGIALIGALKGQTEIMLIGLLLAPIAAITFGIMQGVLENSYLFIRLRSFIAGMAARQWIEGIGGLAVLAAVIILVGGPVPVLAGAVGGAGLGIAYYYLVHRRTDPAKSPALAAGAEVVKQLRLIGLDEIQVQDAVARFGGADWRDQFEALFGYPALVAARTRLGEGAAGAGRSFRLRDRILEWIERREQVRREVAEQRRLAVAEEKAAAAARTEEQKKAREELKKQEALAMERIGQMAAAAAAREAHLKAQLEAQKGETDKARRAAEAIQAAEERRAADLRAAMSLATGMKVNKDKQVEKAEVSKKVAAEAATPEGGSLILDLLLLPVRLLTSRALRVMLGMVILLLALGLKTPEIALEGGEKAISTDGLGLNWGLRAPSLDGKTDVPTANGVFAGAALLISGLFPGMLAGAVAAAGALLMWPGAKLLAGAVSGEILPEFFRGFLKFLALGMPIAGAGTGTGVESLFWVGAGIALAGVALWTVTED